MLLRESAPTSAVLHLPRRHRRLQRHPVPTGRSPAIPATTRRPSYYSHPRRRRPRTTRRRRTSSAASPTGTPSAPTATSRTSPTPPGPSDHGRLDRLGRRSRARPASPSPTARPARRRRTRWQRHRPSSTSCASSATPATRRCPRRTRRYPSRWALDKAVELNPANLSYHPVEAPGTNQTSAMARSLAGTSPYKLWIFETDETVRCLQLPRDATVASPAATAAADAQIDNHAARTAAS